MALRKEQNFIPPTGFGQDCEQSLRDGKIWFFFVESRRPSVHAIADRPAQLPEYEAVLQETCGIPVSVRDIIKLIKLSLVS